MRPREPRPHEPHDWTGRATATEQRKAWADMFLRVTGRRWPFYEWRAMWLLQGHEWSAARGKLERQAWKRLAVSVETWGRAAERCGEAMKETAGAFEAFGETWIRLEREDMAHLRRQHAEWFVPWAEQGRALTREASQ